MTKQLCISADSHVVEPPELFASLEGRFGDRAPRIRMTEDQGPRLDLGNGRLGIAVGSFLQAGQDFGSPDALEHRKKGYELARPGVYEIKARLDDQELDSVDAEILYPSLIFNVYQIEDLDIVKAAFASYNDWLTDYISGAPHRLFGLASIQLYDLENAVQEMGRVKKAGHVGVGIPATAPPSRPYSDRWYDGFWAAAQELKMPLAMHIFTGATPNHGLPNPHADYPLAFAGAICTIADLIYSGVCERFPALRFVITEFETGWTAHMLERLDWAYKRRGGTRGYPNIPEKPSEYWRRNFRITFEDDPIGIMTRDTIGTQTLIWGSDYPHGDSVFPESQAVLDRIMRDCTPQERYEMTAKNVVELYDLPFET
jgi:uncharacterized protein